MSDNMGTGMHPTDVKIEELEERIGELVKENRGLREALAETKKRDSCVICGVDHTGVKGIVGLFGYVCFNCRDFARDKVQGVGKVIVNGIEYKIVPATGRFQM